MKQFRLVRISYHSGGPWIVKHFFHGERELIEQTGRGSDVLQSVEEHVTVKGEDFVRYMPGCSKAVKEAFCEELTSFIQDTLTSNR